MVKKPTPRPARKRPAIRYEILGAPVWRAPPRVKIIEPMVMVHRRPVYSVVGPANMAPKKAPAVKSATTAPLQKSVSCNSLNVDTGDLRIGSCVASVELPVIRWRRNDLGDNTQIIAKEQRSKGRKHSDEELVNLGLHDD